MINTNPRKLSSTDQPRQKIVVGVAGGSAAGKTTLCQNINRQMAFDRNFKVEIISLDSFYKNVDKNQVVDITEYNFDHPNALDFDLAYNTLINLIESNEPVPIPQYSFITHSRQKQPAYIGPANVIFFQGLMAFYDKRIRDLLTYKIFINCDDDIRLCRRLKRDTTERGRSVHSVLEQYNKFVKNAFRDFILPSIVYADIIIPGFRNNRVSVDFIVQHIKNMARRITFKERAVKTKTFIFGQAQIYDLQYLNHSYQIKVTTQQQSFLVFPTSNQHRKQLQFFLTCLLSEMFSLQYFHQIYIHQFLKVLKVLLSQLMSLKNFKSESMEIFSVYHIKEVLNLKNNQCPIKIIFFPAAQRQYSRQILSLIKEYIQHNTNTTFIILNGFCDMNVPQMIYKLKLSNVIMINLFVMANQRRFRQIMINNVQLSCDNFQWFMNNHDIANQAVTTIAKQFHFQLRSAPEIVLFHYQTAVDAQPEPPVKKVIDQTMEKIGNIQQYQVYPQEHGNLCGYHVLNTILCLEQDQSIHSKQIFVENYRKMAKILGNNDYCPLERSSLPVILTSNLLKKYNNIGILLFSFKYIQNTQEQNQQLQQLFTDLIHELKSQIYIILGIHNHYILVKITKNGISYYDSLNNSLRDMWNGTEEHITQKERQHRDYKHSKQHKKHLKQALSIIIDLLAGKTTIQTTMIQKILQDICDSFNIIKDNNAQINNWIANEYPKPVLQSQLLRVLRQKEVQLSPKHKEMFQEWYNHPKIKELLKQDQKMIKI